LRRAILFGLVLGCLCPSVWADDKYTLREKVHDGQVIALELTNDGNFKTRTSESGQTSTRQQKVKQYLKATMTILAVKDGSATSARVQVDPGSYDIEKDDDAPIQKSACWYAGKTVVLTRADDESVKNDAKGAPPEARKVDLDNLNDLLSPDEDMYPDGPVTVGDSWEVSEKLARHSDLNPGDKLLAHVRLDWVKQIDGKQMAQLTCVCGIIRYQEQNVEEDDEYTSVMLVEIAAGQIVRADSTGTVKYLTPAGEAMQVSGGGDFSGHCAVLSTSPPSGATTQP